MNPDCTMKICKAAINGLDSSIRKARKQFSTSSARYCAAVDIWNHKMAGAPEHLTENEFSEKFAFAEEYALVRKWDRESDTNLNNLNILLEIKDFISHGGSCQICPSIETYSTSSNPQSKRQLLNTFLKEAAEKMPSESLLTFSIGPSPYTTKESREENIAAGQSSTISTGPAGGSGA